MKKEEKKSKRTFITRKNYKNLPARLFFENERRVVFKSEISASMNILQPPIIKKKNNVFSQLKPIYFHPGTHNINKNKENEKFKYLEVNFSKLFLGAPETKSKNINFKPKATQKVIKSVSANKNRDRNSILSNKRRNIFLESAYLSILSSKFTFNDLFILEELKNAKMLKFAFSKHHLLSYYTRYQTFINSKERENNYDIFPFYYPVTDDIYMFKSLVCSQLSPVDPNFNARDSFLKAIDTQRQENYQSAVLKFKNVLALNSEQFCVDSSFVYNNMGYCEFKAGNYSAAADDHMKSLAYFDESQQHIGLYNMSRAYFFMNDTKNSELYALEALRKAKEVDDREAVDFLYLQLAYLLFCQAKFKESICLFEVK